MSVCQILSSVRERSQIPAPNEGVEAVGLTLQSECHHQAREPDAKPEVCQRHLPHMHEPLCCLVPIEHDR